MDEITQFVKYTSKISAILPIVVFFSSKSFNIRYINILAMLLFVSFFSDVASIIFTIKGTGNYVIANIYFILEFLLISLIYVHIFQNISRLYHRFLMVSGIGVIVVNSFFGQEFTSVQNITWASCCLLMAAMAFGHFTYILKHPIVKLRSFAPYWITMGLLFYCCSTFVILAFSNVFIKSLGTLDFGMIWTVHNVNNIIKNIFFLFAIFWAPRREPFLQVFNSAQN